jgi:hypothetical protein
MTTCYRLLFREFLALPIIVPSQVLGLANQSAVRRYEFISYAAFVRRRSWPRCI